MKAMSIFFADYAKKFTPQGSSGYTSQPERAIKRIIYKLHYSESMPTTWGQSNDGMNFSRGWVRIPRHLQSSYWQACAHQDHYPLVRYYFLSYFQTKTKQNKKWWQKDSIADRAFTLHTADLGSSLGIPYGPLVPKSARSNFWKQSQEYALLGAATTPSKTKQLYFIFEFRYQESG